jgi:predicted PurR-regulated permease PerM
VTDTTARRDDDAPTPPTARLRAVSESPRLLVAGVILLASLASLYTIYFARGFLLPVSFAFLFTFLLSPVVRWLARLHVPTPIGAALIVLSCLGIAGLAAYGLVGPVEGWVAHAPETFKKAGVRLRVLTKPVDQVTKATEQVEAAASVEASSRAREVVIRGPTLAARLFGGTQALIESVLEIVLLLYFLLAAGDMFLEKLVKVLPQVGDKRKAVHIARAIESSISTYLLTTSAINIGEGTVVALAMWWLGMPTPVVWGVLVACVEFVPYVGMAVAVVALGVTGLSTFGDWPHALAAPGIFLAINLVWGNIVNPLVMSRRLTLNPVALLIGLAFWWWMWDIPGAFLAVPFLATFKIICDHVESLAPIGEFLTGRDPDERRRWIRSRALAITQPRSAA